MHRKTRKEIISLALPVVLTTLLQQAVGIVDIFLVGGLGASSIVAVGLGQLLIFFAMTISWGLSSGVMVVVAQLWGAKRTQEARQIAFQTLLIGIIIGIALSFIGMYLAQWGIIFIGANSDVLKLTEPYLFVIFFFFLFSLLVNLLSSIFYGTGNTKTPLFAAIMINLLHILIAYPLIYGLWGAPSLGVTGAAIGVGLSEMAGTFFLLFFGFKKRILIQGWINHGLIRQVLKVGLPVFADRLLQQAGQMIFVKAIMIYGTATYAAQQVGLVITAFAFLPALGISMATTTLVGQRLGGTLPQHATIVNWEANRLAIWVMTGMGFLFFFAPDPLMKIFTSDPIVIQHGIHFLKIVAFLQIPLAIGMVLSGSLKGAGDTSFLFWTTVIGAWGIRIPLAWLFVLVLDWEVTAVWSLLVVDWVVRMFLLIYRYRSLKWQKKSLIRPLPENQGLILTPVHNE